MKSLLLILLLLLCNSCALFDKYELNQFTAYHKSLTDAEKLEIKSSDKIIKDWYGVNNLGDYEKGKLLITQRNQKLYNFIQIGQWETLHKFYGNLGIIKQSWTFDSLGNLLARESFIKPKKKNNFYLADKVTTKTSEGNKFIQNMERLAPEGWRMYYVVYEYTDYLTPNNDLLKARTIIDLKYFDRDGNEVAEYRDRESKTLIKRVRMKK